MKKLFPVFISLILIISACATDLRVNGFVFTNNGTPIENASVTIERAKKTFETTTDRSGYYVFNNLTSGTWEITVDKEGYEMQSEKVSINGSGGNIYFRDFELKKAVP